MKAGFGAVERVQVAHQALQPGMGRIVQQTPVQLLVVVPFMALTQFAAHEQQLLARMAPHEPVIGAQVGQLGGVVAGHLFQHAALAMHHFVMADRQDVVFAEPVDQAKGHQVMMIAAMDRILLDIAQGVVHPAHVPLEPEAQPAVVHGRRHARPGGAFLGHGHQAFGPFAVSQRVHLLEEFDRFVILAPAVPVRDPLSVLARIIAVEHRRDSIHPQPVQVEVAQPIDRVRAQEVAHFGAAEIVDQRVPVGVKPLAGIGMFVKRRAVELCQAMRVGREMRRHPVHQHAQPLGVRGIDKGAEIVGRAVTAGRCIQAGGLIAP